MKRPQVFVPVRLKTLHRVPAGRWPGVAAALSIGALMITSAAAKEPTMNGAYELHQKGLYERAAQRGLADLLSQPWDHELRFIVADSLQRAGKPDEAVTQLQALEGTRYAETAKARLQTLQQTRPAAGLHGSQLAGAPAASPSAAAPYQLPQFPSLSPDRSVTPDPARTPSLLQAPQPQPPSQPQPAAAAPARSPAAQRIVDLNRAQQYQQAGTEGLALLAREKPDEELQLIIANCLAWTARLSEAIAVYQSLLKGSHANEANVGMANALRWQGQDAQALPLYRSVLANDPNNAGAQQGLLLAQRELRPRTTVSVGGAVDSSEVKRRSATINHRWREDGGASIIELETSGVQDRQLGVEARQQDVTIRYQATALALKPSVELSVADRSERALYGNLRLHFGGNGNAIEVGRVNWGKLAINPNALEANLSASHIGLSAAQGFAVGNLAGRLDYFNVSDGNTIVSGNVRLSSTARPLGSHVKPFVGVELRDAKFNTPNYWSPAEGYGTFYAGLLGEWDALNWSFYASGQAGTRIYGDAGNSWSLSAGGKRWLSNDIGIGVSLWNMASQRDNAAYRAKSVNVSLEKLW